jgi:hypothetical protein
LLEEPLWAPAASTEGRSDQRNRPNKR